MSENTAAEEQKPLQQQSGEEPSAPAAPAQRPVRRAKRRHRSRCSLCKWGFLYADYKDVEFLRKRYLKNNRIVTHKINGNCLKHQHQISTAIKRARMVGLLPFVEE